MKTLSLTTLALVLCGLMLIGCGQKGALYLPEKQTAPIITTETTQAEPSNTDSIESEEEGQSTSNSSTGDKQ